MDNKKFFGEKIAIHRDNLRLTRQDFIDKLNETIGTKYTTQALYSWEKGISIPPADIVPAIANLLNISILDFYGEEPARDEVTNLKNEELRLEVEQLQKENELLKLENKKLEGKVEASADFVKEIMKQREQRMGKS